MGTAERMDMNANRLVLTFQLTVELDGEDEDSGGDTAPAVILFESA